jgi:hypothetical protein
METERLRQFCVVVEAGKDHHFELVRSGNMAMLYVIDAAEATLPLDGMESAKLLVQPKGGKPVSVTLSAHGNHYMGTLDPKATGAAVASVKIGGKTTTARFDLGGDAHAAAHAGGHSHRH